MARPLISCVPSPQTELSVPRLFAPVLGSLAAGLYLLVAAAITWEAFAVFSGTANSFVPALERLLGPLCHHLPGRTLSFNHSLLPVCARCTGIWSGWILAGLLWLLTVNRVRIGRTSAEAAILITLVGLFLAGATLAIFETAGSLSPGNMARAGLGVPLGLFAGWLLLVCHKRHLSGGVHEQED